MDSGIRIGLIHATMNSVQPILDAFRQHAPYVKVLNFMDEGLIDELTQTGNITHGMIRSLINLVERAEESGVDGILLTCSSFSPYVEDIAKLFSVPVLSADISMLEHAVQTAERIGVIATVGAAGPTTTKLLKEIAEKRSKNVSIQTEILTEAFSALQNGDFIKHDELIHQKTSDLSSDCEVVILAQMSMARVLKSLKPMRIQVLTSPEISVKAILSKVTSKKRE